MIEDDDNDFEILGLNKFVDAENLYQQLFKTFVEFKVGDVFELKNTQFFNNQTKIFLILKKNTVEEIEVFNVLDKKNEMMMLPPPNFGKNAIMIKGQNKNAFYSRLTIHKIDQINKLI